MPTEYYDDHQFSSYSRGERLSGRYDTAFKKAAIP